MQNPNDKLPSPPPTTVNIPNKDELKEFASRVYELLNHHGISTGDVRGPMFTELCLQYMEGKMTQASFIHCVRDIAILRGKL